VERQSITVYAMYFEPEFLKESEAFYKSEGETLMDTCDASTLLERVRIFIFRYL
jgi:cullin 3